jgi:hypothetical protein
MHFFFSDEIKKKGRGNQRLLVRFIECSEVFYTLPFSGSDVIVFEIKIECLNNEKKRKKLSSRSFE